MCLDVYDFHGPVVETYSCNGVINQKWQYDASLRSLHLHFVIRIIRKELGRVNEPLTKD